MLEKKGLGDSGGSGETDGDLFGPWDWGWRLGLSVFAAVLGYFPLMFMGLETLAGLALWCVAWRGRGTTTWARSFVALICLPWVLILVFGLVWGAHRGFQEYLRGEAVITRFRGQVEDGGTILVVHPELRLPLEVKYGRYCGNGGFPIFRSSRDMPGYLPTVRALVALLGPMRGSYTGPIPTREQALTRLLEDGREIPRAEIDALARSRPSRFDPLWRSLFSPEDSRHPCDLRRYRRTDPVRGAYLLAREWNLPSEGCREGEARRTLVLMSAASHSPVAIYQFPR